ncbi:hypothetical protein GALL_477140 [mine drainage metagenome]|uniref:Uncharacterized protein n=1 Tax=mine drainage metagenome TaxID=410659 RepID=A0A1J5PGV5_9ZZZZ
MPLRAVTNHGIERVDRLVADDAGQAKQCAPEHRRHDSIGCILGEAFDGSAGNAGFIENCRIAADDLRNGHARTGDIAGLKRQGDRRHIITERTQRDKGP